MNALSEFAAQEVWHITGWTMLHYLWLGTLVGAFAAACRVLLRSARPNVRYATALGCLFLLAVLPFGIAAWLTSQPAPFMEGAGGGFREPIATIELNSPSIPVHDNVIDLRNQHEPLTAAESESQVGAVPTNVPQLDPSPKVATLEACVPYLPWLWIIGTPITFALLAAGVVGTKRLQRTSRPLDNGPVIELLSRLASSLHVARHLSVAVCDRIASPVLVGIVRPMILLPPAALTGWSPDEIEMVLLHELAHVRRWDNLANLIQRLIESLLFFHPAVWLASTWVRRERESCCDAFVVRRTERPHAYAELLLNLAAVHPPLAGLAFARHPLRTRIRRILQLEDDPMLISGKSLTLMIASLFVAATLTVFYLPTIGQAEESTTEDTESSHATKQVESTDDSKSPTTSEFPHEVVFEKGASRFLDGDTITVLEVRGTAAAFEPDNVYWIKGTYTLNSHDRAKLSAFITAKKAVNGTGPIRTTQTTLVDRGTGTFSLVLPMSHKGWPHVSFYPADGGEGFGGTYFGTGDSVLKKWWKSGKSIDQMATGASDDWLKGVEFSSPKDREIAKRAWNELGLKIVPAGDDELKSVRQNGLGGGLRLLEFEDRVNLQGPFILTGIQATAVARGVATFNSLKNALDELAPLPADQNIILSGVANDKKIFSYSLRRNQAAAEGESTSKVASTENSKATPDVSSPSSSGESIKEPQVVVSIPYGSNDPNEYSRVFNAAYEAARANKQYVDLVSRKDGEVLVVIPEPNESNWPDVLGELLRKDRVIAEKAYARLGLKLAPLTRAEATYFQLKGGPVVGAAIVGGNVPKGLPLHSYLTQLDGTGTHSMDAILRWLESETGRANLPVRCNAIADDKEYMFDAAPPTSTPVAKKPQSAPAGKTESPLQPASTDRVVVAYEIPNELNADVRQYIRNADLRGLWDERGRLVFQATPQQHEQFRNLLDATAKLLDAMKKRQPGNPPIPNFIIRKFEGEDVLEWPTAGLTLKRGTRPVSPPGVIAGIATRSAVAVAEVAPGGPAAWRDVRVGDILTTLERFETGSLAEVESILKTLMSSFPDPGKQVTAEFMRYANNRPELHLPTTLPLRLNNDGTPPPVLSTGELEQRRQQAMHKAALSEQQRVLAGLVPKSAQQPNPSTKSNKSNLRYDGKSFLQWRDTWQTELSIEKRLEAVKALAAFGAQGYGQEATESILDVVAEYDPRPLRLDSPEGQLKQAVKEELVTKIPASIWRPLLRKRFDAAPEKWQWLAIATLQQVEPANENDRKDTQAFLLLLADSQESYIASSAVSALVKLDPALENEQIKRLVMERLNGDKHDVVRRIVSDLSRTPQHPPELIDLLLHGEPQCQQLIRQALKRGSHGDADLALVNSLTTMLKDEATAADHLAAMRALAALAPVANGAESKPLDVLQAIVKDGNAENQIAAAFAVGEITQGQIGAGPLLTGNLRKSDGELLDAFAVQTMLESERAAVFGENARR